MRKNNSKGLLALILVLVLILSGLVYVAVTVENITSPRRALRSNWTPPHWVQWAMCCCMGM